MRSNVLRRKHKGVITPPPVGDEGHYTKVPNPEAGHEKEVIPPPELGYERDLIKTERFGPMGA
jgi:hypothetical protein